MPQTARMVERDLKKVGTKEKAKGSARFFKTAPGQYGYGDVFLGVTVPEQRIIAKKYRDLPPSEIKKLLEHKAHECRLTALIILGAQFKNAGEMTRKNIVKFYQAHTNYINNWDLVDSSAGYILGVYLIDKDRKILYRYAASRLLWERRIAIIATQAFIARNDFKDTLRLSELLLGDSHDLMHKAVGWMLREVGKRSPETLLRFIDSHSDRMPRTTLRYAIERFPQKVRKEILGRNL